MSWYKESKKKSIPIDPQLVINARAKAGGALNHDMGGILQNYYIAAGFGDQKKFDCLKQCIQMFIRAKDHKQMLSAIELAKTCKKTQKKAADDTPILQPVEFPNKSKITSPRKITFPKRDKNVPGVIPYDAELRDPGNTPEEKNIKTWGVDPEAECPKDIDFSDIRISQQNKRITTRFYLWYMPGEEHPKIIGTGTLKKDFYHNYAYVINLYIHPCFRGKGIGSFFVNTIIRQAKEWEVSRVGLDTSDKARSLYERMGFEPSETVKRKTYLEKKLAEIRLMRQARIVPNVGDMVFYLDQGGREVVGEFEAIFPEGTYNAGKARIRTTDRVQPLRAVEMHKLQPYSPNIQAGQQVYLATFPANESPAHLISWDGRQGEVITNTRRKMRVTQRDIRKL